MVGGVCEEAGAVAGGGMKGKEVLSVPVAQSGRQGRQQANGTRRTVAPLKLRNSP